MHAEINIPLLDTHDTMAPFCLWQPLKARSSIQVLSRLTTVLYPDPTVVEFLRDHVTVAVISARRTLALYTFV